jgi:hypothetical protein
MADYVGDIAMSDQTTAIVVGDLLGKTVQAKGKKYIYARAGETLTKNTPYGLIHEGLAGTTTATSDPAVKALLSGAVQQFVVVPVFRTMADNDTGWFQYQGPCEDMVVPSATYTATYALHLDAGAVTETGAAPTNGDLEFGSVMVGGTTVTAIDAYLFGRECLSET